MSEIISLQTFLQNVTDIHYTEDECKFIIDNKLLHSWL